jgi:hypothetical protein
MVRYSDDRSQLIGVPFENWTSPVFKWSLHTVQQGSGLISRDQKLILKFSKKINIGQPWILDTQNAETLRKLDLFVSWILMAWLGQPKTSNRTLLTWKLNKIVRIKVHRIEYNDPKYDYLACCSPFVRSWSKKEAIQQLGCLWTIRNTVTHRIPDRPVFKGSFFGHFWNPVFKILFLNGFGGHFVKNHSKTGPDIFDC